MSEHGMIGLMTRLSEDCRESNEFKQDPDGVMAGLDLTAQEKELLKRAQSGEIRGYLGGDEPGLCIWMTCED